MFLICLSCLLMQQANIMFVNVASKYNVSLAKLISQGQEFLFGFLVNSTLRSDKECLVTAARVFQCLECLVSVGGGG